jgi:hypothetical protein
MKTTSATAAVLARATWRNYRPRLATDPMTFRRHPAVVMAAGAKKVEVIRER